MGLRGWARFRGLKFEVLVATRHVTKEKLLKETFLNSSGLGLQLLCTTSLRMWGLFFSGALCYMILPRLQVPRVQQRHASYALVQVQIINPRPPHRKYSPEFVYRTIEGVYIIGGVRTVGRGYMSISAS